MKLPKALKFIVFCFAVAAVVFLMRPFSAAVDAAERQLTVSGGTEGTDYTYEDGVLTFLKSGSYTIGMTDGLTEASDRINIKKSSELTSISLTLNSVNMKTPEMDNIKTSATSGSSQLSVNFILNGTSKLVAKGHPWYASGNTNPDVTISGSGSLSLEATESVDGYNNFNGNNITFKSGTVTMKNIDILAQKMLTVEGGTLNVESPRDTVYVNGGYKQTGGSVILTAQNRCIYAVGAGGQAEPEDGIQILGGDLKMTTKGQSYAVFAGTNTKKNMVIDTDGTVEIDSAYLGVLLYANSSLTVNKGIFKINSSVIGVYTNGSGCQDSKFNVNGGETEITSSVRAIGLASTTAKDIDYGEDYFHKNYDGDDKASRVEVEDDPLIGENGNSKKYVLITPAYKITYDLRGGTLSEGEENPVKYSRVDTFTLKNPAKEGDTFLGWQGTDLSDTTETVTVPEGSKGERSYKAIWKNDQKKYVVTYDPNGGKVFDSEQPVKREYAAGTEITLPEPVRDGYDFLYWEGSHYDAGAKYTVKEDHTFTAQWEEADSGSTPESDPDSGGGSKSGSKSKKNGKNNKMVVNTGDSVQTAWWIILFLAMLTAIVWLPVVRRGRRKQSR